MESITLNASIMECDRYGGESRIVWGGISLDGRTDLQVIKQEGYNSCDVSR